MKTILKTTLTILLAAAMLLSYGCAGNLSSGDDTSRTHGSETAETDPDVTAEGKTSETVSTGDPSSSEAGTTEEEVPETSADDTSEMTGPEGTSAVPETKKPADTTSVPETKKPAETTSAPETKKPADTEPAQQYDPAVYSLDGPLYVEPNEKYGKLGTTEYIGKENCSHRYQSSGATILFYPENSHPGLKKSVCQKCGYTYCYTYDTAECKHPTGSRKEGRNDDCFYNYCGKCGKFLSVIRPLFTTEFLRDNFGKHVLVEPTKSSYGIGRYYLYDNYQWDYKIPPTSHRHKTDGTYLYNNSLHWLKCSCGTYIEPEVHDWTAWMVSKKATCAHGGEKYRICRVCGMVMTESTPALHHVFSSILHADPVSCLENTLGEGFVCDVCGASFRVRVKPAGHDFVDGQCTRCGEADPDYYDCFDLHYMYDPASISVEYNSTEQRTAVTVPGSIKGEPVSIYIKGFGNDCRYLKNVTISEGVVAILERAFEYCEVLTEVDIPDSVTVIYNEAFSRCYALKKLKIGSGMTELPDHFAIYCKSLTEIDIPANVKKIGGGAFAYCTSLSKVTLHEGLEEIGQGAFSGGSGETVMSLKELTIPSTVTFIGRNILYGRAVEKVNLANRNWYYYDGDVRVDVTFNTPEEAAAWFTSEKMAFELHLAE